jgi:hypothetical protein
MSAAKLVLVAVAAGVLVAAPRRALGAQDTTATDTLAVEPPPVRRDTPDLRRAWRFELADAGDSTFRFAAGGARWVRPGTTGIVIDPRRRDALVARFEVQGVDADTAVGLILGQTQRVVPEHVALLAPPKLRPWQQRPFWQGALSGAFTAAMLTAIGFLVAR